MSIRKLPPKASLENLKKQAKSLLKAAKENDAATLSRVRFYFDEPSSIGLQDAQLVIARDYGYSSWRKMRQHLDTGAALDQPSNDQLANEFLRLAMLVYSETEGADPERFLEAAKLLQDHPQIRNENIYTAVASGEVELVEQWLEVNPDLINRKGGFFQWEPLMYAAYSRLPGVSTLDVGRLLLEQGADPNPFYLWDGQYRFTALTGVFGHGEGGADKLPEHPDCDRFARLLLGAGADPNDSQAAYNRMLSGDNSCLKMLLEYGLTASDKNNWLLRENDKLVPHPQETLHYQLCHAVQTDNFEKLELLVAHGVDVNQTQDDRSPYQLALLAGNEKFADFLLAHGAKEIELAVADRFRIACLKPDRALAVELLAENPGLIEAVLQASPDILEHAVAAAQPDALRLMLDLGFDINHVTYRSALHQAAWMGRIDMMQLLIDAGADTTQRDHFFFGAPLAWALQNNQTAAAEFLDNCAMDIFTAAARENLPQLEQLLAEDPQLLEIPFGDIRPNKSKPCDTDWMTPLAFAIANQKAATVKFLLDRGANRQISDGKGLSASSLAREQGNSDILALLEFGINTEG